MNVKNLLKVADESLISFSTPPLCSDKGLSQELSALSSKDVWGGRHKKGESDSKDNSLGWFPDLGSTKNNLKYEESKDDEEIMNKCKEEEILNKLTGEDKDDKENNNRYVLLHLVNLKIGLHNNAACKKCQV